MGCDIHLYIEHKNTGDASSWWNFGSQFRLDRDYGLFARMAGVRNYGDEIKPIAELRGLPSDISWGAKDGNRLFVVDSESHGEGEATRTAAERWIQSGSSVADGTSFVTHPDWHSHSWLSKEEFEECLNTFERVSNDYKAVLAVLNSFESNGEMARVVFWFDN